MNSGSGDWRQTGQWLSHRLTGPIAGCLLLAAIFPANAPGHVTYSTKITWSREIVRVVQQRCLSCHRDGGSGPFSMESYEQARPWAKAIQEEVLTRRMPPWGAVKGFGEFRPDHGLTQEEVNLLAEWVEGGAPEGDPSHAPAKRSPALIREPAPGPVSERSLGSINRIPSTWTLVGFRTGERTRVMAELPDGSREPLLWVIEPARRITSYWLAQPRRYPAGTVLTAEGTVTALFTATPRPRQTPPSSPSRSGQTEPKHGASPAAERSH